MRSQIDIKLPNQNKTSEKIHQKISYPIEDQENLWCASSRRKIIFDNGPRVLYPCIICQSHDFWGRFGILKLELKTEELERAKR